jgi:hypothetical protein
VDIEDGVLRDSVSVFIVGAESFGWAVAWESRVRHLHAGIMGLKK